MHMLSLISLQISRHAVTRRLIFKRYFMLVVWVTHAMLLVITQIIIFSFFSRFSQVMLHSVCVVS